MEWSHYSVWYSGDLNSEHIVIQNVLKLEWSVIAIAKAMVPTIVKPNHWKSKQNGVWISHGFGQNGCHFVHNRSPLENQTEGYH